MFTNGLKQLTKSIIKAEVPIESRQYYSFHPCGLSWEPTKHRAPTGTLAPRKIGNTRIPCRANTNEYNMPMPTRFVVYLFTNLFLYSSNTKIRHLSWKLSSHYTTGYLGLCTDSNPVFFAFYGCPFQNPRDEMPTFSPADFLKCIRRYHLESQIWSTFLCSVWSHDPYVDMLHTYTKKIRHKVCLDLR